MVSSLPVMASAGQKGGFALNPHSDYCQIPARIKTPPLLMSLKVSRAGRAFVCYTPAASAGCILGRELRGNEAVYDGIRLYVTRWSKILCLVPLYVWAY